MTNHRSGGWVSRRPVYSRPEEMMSLAAMRVATGRPLRRSHRTSKRRRSRLRHRLVGGRGQTMLA